MIASLWQQRSLLLAMTVRDIGGRYKGSAIGLAWSMAIPLLMLLVYTAVFGGIFKARWGGSGSTMDFSLQLFCGLLLHGMVAECLLRSPQKLIEHASYVKKVVFPLEILPVTGVGGALFHAVISLLLLLLVVLVLRGGLPITVLAVPVVLLSLLLFCLGISWFLAAITVYLRDVTQLTGLLATLLLFLSPIFYPIEMIPEAFRGLMAFNPLTVPVEQLRLVVLSAQWPQWPVLGLHGLASLVVAWLGYAWFQKTRKGFADVL
ncbi:ABC transporter permease [Alcaligenaceae bacterium]|nr:ABC transporter permease [Alcaligenaceae bacterium]